MKLEEYKEAMWQLRGAYENGYITREVYLGKANALDKRIKKKLKKKK